MSAKPLSSDDRSSFTTVRDYLEHDSRPVPDALFETSSEDLGNRPIPKSLFTSKEVAEREAEHLWTKTWQMACRENDIPNVGSRITYDILGHSFVILRSAENQFKAFYNVCMHRGTRLVGDKDPHSGGEISCSFHNWSYNLDGSIKNIPCRWDFPEVRDEQVHLKEVAVGCWNGFVFINMDPDCEPFEDFIGETLPRHFKNWPYDRAVKVAHIGKVLPVNWKVAVSAFQEVYHVNRTHADLLPFSGDCNSQYDNWGDHARQIMCTAVPSPHMGDLDDPHMIFEGFMNSAIGNIYSDGEDNLPEIDDDASVFDVRRICANIARQAIQQKTGVDHSEASDTEIIDSIQYFVFPNLFVFGGKAFPLSYRVTPIPGDHEKCLFDVMVLMNTPEGTDLPKDTPMQMTPAEESWLALVDIIGKAANIFEQDQVNLDKFQAGLRQEALTHVHLANYQERNVRNFLQAVMRRIGEKV